MRSLYALLIAGAAGACSMTVPVSVITAQGETLRGSNTVTMADGTFTVSNARMSCTGQYDPSARARTITIVAKCSDGRTGIGEARRDTLSSGSGTITMSDGTTARFVFGDLASGF